MAGLIGRIIMIVFAAYFLGNMNGAIIISSLLDKDDVRTHGSGNAGMTNYMRSYGFQKAGLVIIIDLGKGILAAFLGALLLEPYGYYAEGAMLAGLCVSLGHDFPAAQGFRGGKGIMCGWGVSMVADWRVSLIVLTVFLACVLLSRYVSLGSSMAAFSLGISFTILHLDKLWVVILGWAIACLALFMHRGNISRLLHGTERKISFHHKEEKL